MKSACRICAFATGTTEHTSINLCLWSRLTAAGTQSKARLSFIFLSKQMNSCRRSQVSQKSIHLFEPHTSSNLFKRLTPPIVCHLTFSTCQPLVSRKVDLLLEKIPPPLMIYLVPIVKSLLLSVQFGPLESISCRFSTLAASSHQ